MLSDLYVPQDIDPDSPVLSDCSDEDSEWMSGAGSDDDGDDDDDNVECSSDEEKSCSRQESQSVTPANPSSTIKVSSLCLPHATKTQSQYYKLVRLEFCPLGL